MVDLNLPIPTVTPGAVLLPSGEIVGDPVWAEMTVAAFEDVQAALAAAGVAFTMEGTELVVQREDGTEVRLPIPAGKDGSNVVPTNTAVRDTVTGDLATPGSAIETAFSAKFGQRLHYLDSYVTFFGGGKFVTGQSTAATTLTSAVTAGTTVLPLASASGVIAGVQLVMSEGTSGQEIVTVASNSGSSATLTAPIVNALPSGAAVTPLWANSSHLGLAGYTAFAYFIANARTSTGEYIITGTTPKVTYLGNSWFAQGGSRWAAQLNARIPGATIVNAGISGNTSAALLARFATDVPTDSDYVIINEPGVNDDSGNVVTETQIANLVALTAKITAIGAIPIYAGNVPLADFPVASAVRHDALSKLIGDGSRWPAASATGTTTTYIPESRSLGFGIGALERATTGSGSNTAIGYYSQGALTTGTKNTGIGPLAQANLTTGSSNTAIGDSSQLPLTTGTNNTAVGQSTQRNLTTAGGNTAVGQAAQNGVTTGNFNTAIGGNAQLALTTGPGNSHIGHGAGYSPNNDAANATTTAFYQTCIGYQTGLATPAQANYITAIGYRATVTASGGAAIGTDSGGAGAKSEAVNEIALGTALHTVKIRGKANLPHGAAPTTPTDGDVWTTTAGLFVRVNGATVGPLS